MKNKREKGDGNMICSVRTLGISGIQGSAVTAECYISQGLPGFDIVGLPDAAVKEARDRVRAAAKSSGLSFPVSRITVNLAPASQKKAGTHYDLPILLSILAASGSVRRPKSTSAFLGELSLDGTIRPISGVLPMALTAARLGIDTLYVPEANAAEATLADGLTVYGVTDVGQLIAHLKGEQVMTPAPRWTPGHQDRPLPDFADVMGQENVKRALEIAAAGGHNVIMVGAPGSGKTMLARRLPTILPPLSREEALETTKIHSVAGKAGVTGGLMTRRPFRAPHHTASQVAVIGGGQSPRPGEVSLAHNGVLFLDELPEFGRSVLEVLRQPLEEKKIVVSRARYNVEYPANFTLVAAMNPCPCGYAYGNGERCTCREKDRVKYFSRLSGPILDRIDIQIEVPPVERISPGNAPSGDSSHAIRLRVIVARQMAQERFREFGWCCNAQATGTWLRANTSPKAIELVNRALASERLSLRGADRAMRLAWTLSDLAGKTSPGPEEMMQGISMRTRLA